MPNAALHAATSRRHVCLLLVAFVDTIWALADLDPGLTTIDTTHIYKGRGKDPADVRSFRPLGIARPLLSLVVDVLHLRLSYFIRRFVGPRQLGGLCDSRCHVVVFRSIRAARRHLKLPSVDGLVDAKFGFDGGRHSQALAQLHLTAAHPRDWLITDALLRTFTIHVRVMDPAGLVGLLDPVHPDGGSMVQGLSASGDLYTLLPAALEDRLCSTLPLACAEVPTTLLEAYRSTAAGDVDTNMCLDLDDVRLRAWRLESLMRHVPANGIWPASAIPKVIHLFQRCASDAERLLLLGWVAHRDPVALALFIDDARALFSSPAACIIGLQAISPYAAERGVVYESGGKEKSVVLPDGLTGPGRDVLQLALSGCLQSGTPTVVTHAVSMGIAENIHLSEAQTTLVQIEHRGAQVTRGACTAAQGVPWPLAARRLYLSRGHSTIAHLLPFVIGYQHAALRLNALQSRWAHAALMGPWIGRRPCLSRATRKQLMADLGWTSLWVSAVVGSIVFRQRLLLDGPYFAHGRLAAQHTQPDGSWMAAVRSLQLRFRVSDFDLAAAHAENLSIPGIKRRLKEYRRSIVEPAVLSGLGYANEARMLPWAWISTVLHTPSQTASFHAWWIWRTLSTHPGVVTSCGACRRHVPPTANHLQAECPASRSLCAAAAVPGGAAHLFARPSGPDGFRAQLRVVEELLLRCAAPEPRQ